MEIEFIQKTKNELEFVVKNEDSSFYDMIVNELSSKKDVEFVSKKNADELAKEFTIYLRTKEKNAKDVFLDAINETEEKFLNILKSLEKSAEKIN